MVSYVAVKFADEYARTLTHRELDTTKEVTDSHGVTTTQKVVAKEDAAFETKMEEHAEEALEDV